MRKILKKSIKSINAAGEITLTNFSIRIFLSMFIVAFICNVALASNESLQDFANKKGFIDITQAQEIDRICMQQVAQKETEIFHLHPHKQTYNLEITRLECESKNLQDTQSSTRGLLAIHEYLYAEYDKLLNKYYRLYRAEFRKRDRAIQRGLFNDEPSIEKGQDTLLEEQRAWLKLRDSYEAYLRAARLHTYDVNDRGMIDSNYGGKIWIIEAASAHLEFLAKRVDVLFWRYHAMLSNELIDLDNIFDNAFCKMPMGPIL